MERIDKKFSVFLIVMLGMLSACASIVYADNDISVEIELSASELPTCGAVAARVTISNDGQFPVSLPASAAVPHYWINLIITGPDGQELSYVGPEVQIVGVDRTISLFPEMFYGTTVNVSCDSYDLSVPGKYSIAAVFGKGPTRSRDLDNLVRSAKAVFVVTATNGD